MKNNCKESMHSWVYTIEGYNTQKDFNQLITFLNKAGFCYRIINSTTKQRWYCTPQTIKLTNKITQAHIQTAKKNLTWRHLIDQATGEIIGTAGDIVRILVYKNAK